MASNDREFAAMSGQRERGIALAVLVWFLAALSLLVGSLVSQARLDTRLAQLHMAQAQAAALGDGAALVALERWYGSRQNQQEAVVKTNFELTLGGVAVQVTVTPVSGLIDLNRASESLLQRLFHIAGKMDAEVAQQQAVNVVQWRSPAGSQQSRRFKAVQDILRVPDIGRTVLENIRDSVYASEGGSQGVDWRSAPASVLAVLADDPEVVSQVLQARISDRTLQQPPPGIALEYLGGGSAREYRIDARMTVQGLVLLRRNWVRMGRGQRGLLPWQVQKRDPVAVIATARQAVE